MSKCVLQPWVVNLPMMQQTVLLTAVRGPDGIPKYGPVKLLQRWYRRCVLYMAMGGVLITDPCDQGGGSFTGPSLSESKADWRPRMDLLVDQYLQQVDALPHHYQLHFMHAVEIIGYKHPDALIKCWWHGVYLRLVNDMHLQPETVVALDERLGDCEAGWRRHADAATVG